ncbi:hypothetical protein HYPSUDRAFT_43271 [Hypholoma sublateritium FD-334 SS-4]|uniref:Uncharacterized protein n=1 Tax=Hypholoma sublateritium (strain FD-334 SS-4) TaxID=945553 RepID=A0A0D2NNH4_HYPSF|nr:hypothetical protein HYPSUDRAFT_43271 [Hypholoma sublateritium FD-334 SS-4]
MDRAQQTVARRVPCYCHKCDGALVSVRTERNHRKSPRAPDKSRYGKMNAHTIEEQEGESSSDSESSQPSEGTSRVKKRPRTTASGSKNVRIMYI